MQKYISSDQAYIQKQLGIIRNGKNITQEELAEKILLSPKSISDIENGRRGVSLKKFLAICDVLEINLKEFFKDGHKSGR